MGCKSSKQQSASAPQPQQQQPAPTASQLGTACTLLPPGDHVKLQSATGETSQDWQSNSVPVASAALSNSQYSDGTRSHASQGLLRKQRTMATKKHDLDIMITGFSAHDSTVGSAIGRNCKEVQWKVMYDRDQAPIDIKLHVQEHKLHSNEVSIESNGKPIFHGAGAHAKAKMLEDFLYQWPFRASIRGINEAQFFEYHPPHMHDDAWFPATITAQRDDGFFEVTAMMPAGNRWTEMKYPAVSKQDLREATTKQAISVPETFLQLEVPKQNPLNAVLSVNGTDHVTHHFGRPSPPPAPAGKQPEIASFKVNKERTAVTANFGHAVLSHLVSGEVRAVSSEVERLRHAWTVQIGPFAEHKIEIVKKYTVGKILTLLVDGEVFVDACAADLGCQDQTWECAFRFIGERVMDFEVYKTNKDGAPLDTTDHVQERRKYTHECKVVVDLHEWDLRTAKLIIDDSYFNELPQCRELHSEPPLSMDPRAMCQSYGISVPYKVDHLAPSGFALLADSVLKSAGSAGASPQGIFSMCCNPSTVVVDDSR